MSAFVSAIIVAAGGSTRMGSSDSKQFIALLGADFCFMEQKSVCGAGESLTGSRKRETSPVAVTSGMRYPSANVLRR